MSCSQSDKMETLTMYIGIERSLNQSYLIYLISRFSLSRFLDSA